MRHLRSMVVFAGLSAALATTAAACGGSDNSGGSSTNSQGPATQEQKEPAQHPKSLVGEVGKNDAFEISLTDDKGNAITNLAAGTYKLAIHDDSDIHNFHLTGGDVNDSTSVGSSG